jgi:LysM repeat protein
MRLRVSVTLVSVTLAAATMLGAPVSASAAFAHVVAPGESLSSVAASDGLSVEELAAANGLSPAASLIAGSTLMIPPRSAAGIASETAVGETAASGEAAGGPVASGEAAGGPAASGEAAGESSAGSSAGDGDADSDDVGAAPDGSTAQAGSSASAGTEPEGATAEGSSSAPPYPTAQTVSPTEVGSIAAEDGVPPSLAQAVADQESGFNNDLTSSADARGVMQILPGTWSWINETLVSRPPLEPASAASNVHGGVLLLHSLLEATGDDPALAAAGYYQGLQSVLHEGESPSTQQYVGDVLALQRQFGGE